MKSAVWRQGINLMAADTRSLFDMLPVSIGCAAQSIPDADSVKPRPQRTKPLKNLHFYLFYYIFNAQPGSLEPRHKFGEAV